MADGGSVRKSVFFALSEDRFRIVLFPALKEVPDVCELVADTA